MRDLVTDLLEICGLVLLVAAAAVAVWRMSPALALVVAGVGLLGASLLLTATAPKKPKGDAL